MRAIWALRVSSAISWRMAASSPIMRSRIFRASVVFAMLQLLCIAMGLRILCKGVLAPDGPFDVHGRHLAFFRQRVRQHRQALAMEEGEDPILDPSPPSPQLIDAIAEVIGLWAAEFVPQRSQALNPGDAGRAVAARGARRVPAPRHPLPCRTRWWSGASHRSPTRARLFSHG